MSSKNYLFFDGGSSSQKILASIDGFFYGLMIPPGAMKLNRLNEYDSMFVSDRDCPHGVGIVEYGKELWRVGDMPEVCHTAAAKASSMVPKIIAAISSIIGSCATELDLVILLPCDEYVSRAELARQLRKAIADARFNGEGLNVEIPGIRFYAEGSGLAAHLPGVNVACMVGHSDLSLVHYENGRINLGRSRTYGGAGIGVISASLGVPGGDIHIAKALATNDYSVLSISGISVGSIRSGYKARLKEYFKRTLIPSLKSYSWVGVDQVVIGGGGAYQVKEAIARILSLPVQEAVASESLRLFNDGLEPVRFADIYGIAKRFVGSEIAAKAKGNSRNSVDELLTQVRKIQGA